MRIDLFIEVIWSYICFLSNSSWVDLLNFDVGFIVSLIVLCVLFIIFLIHQESILIKGEIETYKDSYWFFEPRNFIQFVILNIIIIVVSCFYAFAVLIILACVLFIINYILVLLLFLFYLILILIKNYIVGLVLISLFISKRFLWKMYLKNKKQR